ncbi:MAG: Sialic acid TRAP transporter permease protein SiaT [Syntrophorhabdus sp. PtaU1.Bin058]|nr:MAG: Sialic acid TRAP transporter permease protein SiaT [Syntrophorhabdus sp. PtaU1.Bin058]
MSTYTTGVVGILLFVVLILFGRMKIGLALTLVGFLGYSIIVTPEAGFSLLGRRVYSTISDYGLAVVPLFILMGELNFYSGLSSKLYDAAYKLCGKIPGGLAISTIFGCSFFAAICGSGPATAAAMGTVALPEMKKYRYDRKFATGCVASGGTLGILIPPSLSFIMYGIMAEQSIGKLFIAGILPGILLAVLFCTYVYVYAKFNPVKVPTVAYKIVFKEKIVSVLRIWDSILLLGFVLGGLYIGLFTPTEAGALGVFGSLAIAVIKKSITPARLISALEDTLNISGMIFIIIIGAIIFSNFLAVTKISLAMGDLASRLNPYMLLAFISLTAFIAGCIMDAPGMIALLTPVFLPAIEKSGFDPIWFGVMITLLAQMGLVTPPVGLNVYAVAGIEKDTRLNEIFAGAIPFIAAMLLCMIIMAIFPQIALFLPNRMK